MVRVLVSAVVLVSLLFSAEAVRQPARHGLATAFVQSTNNHNNNSSSLVTGKPNEEFVCCCSAKSKTNCAYQKIGSCSKSKDSEGIRINAKENNLGGKCKILDKTRTQLSPATHSREWNMCRTWKKMNTEVLPPSKFAGYAVRLAIPNDGLKDLYVAIKTVEFVEADYHMVFKRKDQTSFSFKLTGKDGGVAKLRLFLGGMNLYSDGALIDTAKAIASTEKWATRILTLGIAGRGNYASLDDLALEVDVQMECEFKLNAKDKWEIVPESRKQIAEPRVENGGLFFGIINLVIDSFGGIDTIFFNSVWPIVEKMAPPSLGQGFQEIPFEAGQLEQRVDFTIKCPGMTPKTTRCPVQEMEMDVAAKTHILAKLYPLLKKLDTEGFFVQPALKKLTKNVLATYESGQTVFEGAEIDIKAHADLSTKKEGSFKMTPTIKAPVGLLETLIGNAMPFKNFLPKNGDPLVAEGTLSIADGTVEGKNMVLDPLTLPFGSKDETINMRMEVGFKLELEDAGGDPNYETHMIFSKMSPLKFDVTQMHTSISAKDGFAFNPQDDKGKNAKETVELLIDQNFLSSRLKETGQAVIVPPANPRNGTPDQPDGQVPLEFMEPYSTRPQPLDINNIFDSGGLKFSFQVHPTSAGSSRNLQSTAGQQEVVGMDFDLGSSAKLKVGAKVYSALVENKKVDYGYYHAFVPGSIHWDNKYKNGIITMSCGMLSVYVLPGSIAEVKKRAVLDPDDKLFPDIDLSKQIPTLFKYKDGPTEITKAGKKFEKPRKYGSGSYQCFQIGEEKSNWAWTSNDPKWFCSDPSSLKHLLTAIQTQVARLQTSRWRDTCVPGLNGTHPVCSGTDGTWFKVYNPLDKSTWFPGRPFKEKTDKLMTPHEEWDAAVKTILKRL